MGARQLKFERPSVFAYHDHVVFLRDWFTFLENTEGETLRKFACKAGLGVALLSMVLRGHRNLTDKTLGKIEPHLKLNAHEIEHFKLLIQLAQATHLDQREKVLNQLQKRARYKELHPKEFETFHYLSHWYFVAIREMSALPDFQPSAEWIQSRLQGKVALAEIEKALSFLIEHQFIDVHRSGKPTKALDCMGGVYKLALGTFHLQALERIGQAIDEVKSEDRHILGHTVALPKEKLHLAKSILDEALAKIADLGEKSTQPNEVYHVELAVVPWTKRSEPDEN